MATSEMENNNFKEHSINYLNKLFSCFTNTHYQQIELLANDLRIAWSERKNVYICGNGGSAANAIHIANDFHYGIGACGIGAQINGLKIEALPANTAILPAHPLAS